MKSIKSDFTTEKDIRFLVSAFYQKACRLLGLPINSTSSETLQFACFHFWKSVILDSKNYLHHPLREFALYPFSPLLTGEWIDLFCQTVDENFIGTNATKAKCIAISISQRYESKILAKHSKSLFSCFAYYIAILRKII